MYNWKDARNYRRFRDENGNVIANIIYVDGKEVAVSDEVYEAYASMDRRERYLMDESDTPQDLSFERCVEDCVPFELLHENGCGSLEEDLERKEMLCNAVSTYEHFIHVCTAHGLSELEVRSFLEYQILTDFVLTNTERHLNNFGVLRNSRTLKFVRMAPIFDSGNYDSHARTDQESLCYDGKRGCRKRGVKS